MASIGGTLEMARESYAVAYVTAVCATTLLFDYCLTFGVETKRMWPTALSVPKFLFMVDRYVVLPMLVFNGIASTRNHLSATVRPFRCVFYLRWLVVCITVTNATVEGILLTRVIALYRKNTPVIILASSLYVAGIGTLIGLTVNDYIGETVQIVQDFSALPGCYAASVPSIIAGYWVTSTVVEFVFFILVVYRVILWSRDNMSVPPALRLMARDSTVYFALIFALLIVNLFVFEYAPPFLSSLFVTPANTAGCIAGARMLMNLRTFAARGEAGITDSGDSSDFEMSRVSALRFGHRTGVSTSTPSTTTSISWARNKLSSGKKFLYSSTISTMSTAEKTDLDVSSKFDSEAVDGVAVGLTSESVGGIVTLPTVTFSLPPHDAV